MSFYGSRGRVVKVATALARAAGRSRAADQHELGYSLTGGEVEALCAGRRGSPVTVAAYSQVFPHDAAAQSSPAIPAVFLWRERDDYGHWCSVWERAPGVLAVFDSYGVTPPDAWRCGVRAEKLAELGQERPRILDHALSRGYSRVEWNDHPLQARSAGVTTCGRWCALRLAFSELDPEEFAAACSMAANSLGISLDDLVVRLTRM